MAIDTLIQDATEFLQLILGELKKPQDEVQKRIQQVVQEINKTGTWTQTKEELEYGCKIAWRNNAHCIGKVHWKILQVFDCRDDTTEEQIFEHLLRHIRYAMNMDEQPGLLRSTVTLYRPRVGDKEIRIWNPQIIRYAGYKNKDGVILGDPDHVSITEAILKLGWKKEERTQFDILPIVIQIDGKPAKFFDLPKEYTQEVKLSHPDYPSFDELDLKWHALPAITNMKFDLGGVVYTATAFNGWYMNTEISRNLLDSDRYDLSEQIGKSLGIFNKDKNSLWQDKTLVELNRAILYSYDRDNVKMIDHHTASKQFVNLIKTEEKAGRETPAKWSWIVPPVSSHLCPVFHKRMRMFKPKPVIDYQSDAWNPSNIFVPRGEVEQYAETEDFNSTALKKAPAAKSNATRKGTSSSNNDRMIIISILFLVFAFFLMTRVDIARIFN